MNEWMNSFVFSLSFSHHFSKCSHFSSSSPDHVAALTHTWKTCASKLNFLSESTHVGSGITLWQQQQQKKERKKETRALNTPLRRSNGPFCPFRQWRLLVRDGNAGDSPGTFDKAFNSHIFFTADRCVRKCQWRCPARSLPDAVLGFVGSTPTVRRSPPPPPFSMSEGNQGVASSPPRSLPILSHILLFNVHISLSPLTICAQKCSRRVGCEGSLYLSLSFFFFFSPSYVPVRKQQGHRVRPFSSV